MKFLRIHLKNWVFFSTVDEINGPFSLRLATAMPLPFVVFQTQVGKGMRQGILMSRSWGPGQLTLSSLRSETKELSMSQGAIKKRFPRP